MESVGRQPPWLTILLIWLTDIGLVIDVTGGGVYYLLLITITCYCVTLLLCYSVTVLLITNYLLLSWPVWRGEDHSWRGLATSHCQIARTRGDSSSPPPSSRPTTWPGTCRPASPPPSWPPGRSPWSLALSPPSGTRRNQSASKGNIEDVFSFKNSPLPHLGTGINIFQGD